MHSPVEGFRLMAYVFILGNTQLYQTLSIPRIVGIREAKEKYTPLFYVLETVPSFAPNTAARSQSVRSERCCFR